MPRKGGWVQTFTGKKFWPLDPRPEEIDIIDIAHALSMKCRFNGHCTDFYSVAEHSVLVSANSPRVYQLKSLLHDGAEAYLPDIPSPIKHYINGFDTIEFNVMETIRLHFNLTFPMDPLKVKLIDKRMLATEEKQIMSDPPEEWQLTSKYEPIKNVKIKCLSSIDAFNTFIERFNYLVSQGFLSEEFLVEL